MKTMILVAVLFWPLLLSAQRAPDTLSIPEVQVHSKKTVRQAGINRQQIDSLVMQREANAS